MRPTSWLLVAFLLILARDLAGKPDAVGNGSATVTPEQSVNRSSPISPPSKAPIGLSTTTNDFPTEDLTKNESLAPTSTRPTSKEWTTWDPNFGNETEPTSNDTDVTETAKQHSTTKTEAYSTSESSSSSPTTSSASSTSKKPAPPPIHPTSRPIQTTPPPFRSTPPPIPPTTTPIPPIPPTLAPRPSPPPSTETTTEDEDDDEDSGWLIWLCILLPILGCIVGVLVVFFWWRNGKKKEAEKEKAEMKEKQKEKKKKEKKGGVDEGKGEKKSEKTEKSTPSEPIAPAGVPAAKATKTAKAKKNSAKKPKKGKSKFEPPPPGSQPRFFIPAKDIKFMGPLVMQPRHVGSFTHEDDKEEHSEVKPFKEIVIDKDMMVAYEIGDGVEKFKTDDGSDSTEEMSEYFKDYEVLNIGPVVPSKGVKGKSAAKSTR